MSVSQVLAITAIIVPCVTALLVAYWHRKQMRQIELFRQNPDAGLVPPDSKLYRFLRARGQFIIGIGLPALGLFLELLNTSAVTRYSLLIISLDVSSIFFFIQLFFHLKATESLELVVAVFDKHSKMFDAQTQLIESHTEIIEKLVTRKLKDPS